MYAYNSESLNLFIFGYSNDTWPSHKEFETSTRTEICFNFHNTTVRTVRRLIFFCYIISRYVNDTVKDNPIARFPFLSNHQTDLSGLFFTFSEQHYK